MENGISEHFETIQRDPTNKEAWMGLGKEVVRTDHCPDLLDFEQAFLRYEND